MLRRFWACGLPIAFAMSGCFPEEKTVLVPSSPFGGSALAQVPGRASYSAASAEVATRVGVIGHMCRAVSRILERGRGILHRRPAGRFELVAGA